ncbi:MAG: hypothetical protein AAFO77_13345 [Pseudomonadota bacterium]
MNKDEWVEKAMQVGLNGDARGAIQALVKLSELIGEVEGAELAKVHRDKREAFTLAYRRWILRLEADEVNKVLSVGLSGGAKSYRDVASSEGVAAYDRVADLFDCVDFKPGSHFVLVGAGELPMTALHVHDRSQVGAIKCLDTRRAAVARVSALGEWMNSDRLVGVLSDGAIYDYSEADTVFIANMVSPKANVLSRILDTAKPSVQIILRDPYSLGHLWAEAGSQVLDERVEVAAVGPGSRFLSRDLFLRCL